MRHGQKLEAAPRQHADLCKLISAKAVTLHTILLGVGGTCYTEHHDMIAQTSFNKWDWTTNTKLAHKLHAHSDKYVSKLVTNIGVLFNVTLHSQVLEPGASRIGPITLQIPKSTFCSVALWWRELTALPS
eukprot:1159319-Pelagomonas_calceolata.AAC.9